jgi:hypothetical protein
VDSNNKGHKTWIFTSTHLKLGEDLLGQLPSKYLDGHVPVKQSEVSRSRGCKEVEVEETNKQETKKRGTRRRGKKIEWVE